jgi:hypothetical protein
MRFPLVPCARIDCHTHLTVGGPQVFQQANTKWLGTRRWPLTKMWSDMLLLVMEHRHWPWQRPLLTKFPEHQLESMPGPKHTGSQSTRGPQTLWMPAAPQKNLTR